MTQHLKCKTMPDFFGERYGSDALKVTASVIVFIFLIPYTASVYNGLSRLFGMAFHIPYTVCVIVMAVFTAVYVILGFYFKWHLPIKTNSGQYIFHFFRTYF